MTIQEFLADISRRFLEERTRCVIAAITRLRYKMICINCEYCRFPRSANDNSGACKCKLMKYKTIDVYVSGGETPEWCPRNKIQKENKENDNV